MICAKEFIDKFGQIYNFLEDQESRETYMARIHYLITGDFGYYRRFRVLPADYTQILGRCTADKWNSI